MTKPKPRKTKRRSDRVEEALNLLRDITGATALSDAHAYALIAIKELLAHQKETR